MSILLAKCLALTHSAIFVTTCTLRHGNQWLPHTACRRMWLTGSSECRETRYENDAGMKAALPRQARKPPARALMIQFVTACLAHDRSAR